MLTNGDSMKINMNTVLTDITGEEQLKLDAGVDETGKPKTKPGTLRAVIQGALGAPVKGDDLLSDDDRLKLYRLGKRLNADEVALSAADIVTITKRVGKHWASAYVFGQVCDLLEPPEDADVRKPNGVDHHPN